MSPDATMYGLGGCSPYVAPVQLSALASEFEHKPYSLRERVRGGVEGVAHVLNASRYDLLNGEQRRIVPVSGGEMLSRVLPRRCALRRDGWCAHRRSCR